MDGLPAGYFVSNLNNKRVVKLMSGILELLALLLESYIFDKSWLGRLNTPNMSNRMVSYMKFQGSEAYLITFSTQYFGRGKLHVHYLPTKGLNNKSNIEQFANSKAMLDKIPTMKPRFIWGSGVFNTPMLRNGMEQIKDKNLPELHLNTFHLKPQNWHKVLDSSDIGWGI